MVVLYQPTHSRDSILDFDYANIGDKMRTDYDVPMLKKEKQILIGKLVSKRHILIVALGAILILCVYVIHYYRRQRKLNKTLQNFKDETAKIVNYKVPSIKSKPLKISDEIVKNILERLEAFEQAKLYVNNDVKLHFLAKFCKTNVTYLSKVINHYKKMNVSTYLKKLRISNAIDTIKANDKYARYSISGLAKEFGFSTAESFSNAFKEKTGRPTSLFLNDIRKHKKKNS